MNVRGERIRQKHGENLQRAVAREDRFTDRERGKRYEVEGIRLSYLSSRIFGAIAGIERESAVTELLARPHGNFSVRRLIARGLIDGALKLTPLGEHFAGLVRKPLAVKTIFGASINFGDPRLPRRFWNKVIPEPNSSCWFWLGAHVTRGYGHFGVNAGVKSAHRIAYIILRGPIPDDLEIDHRCRNPYCVNPQHLEPVTHSVNVKRGWDAIKESYERSRGTRNHHGRFSNETPT